MAWVEKPRPFFHVYLISKRKELELSISVFLHDEEKIIKLDKTYDGCLKLRGACELDSFIKQLSIEIGNDTGWLTPNTIRQYQSSGFLLSVNYWPINKPVDCLMRGLGSSVNKLFIPNIIMMNLIKDNVLHGSYIAGTKQSNMLNVNPETMIYDTGLPNTYSLEDDAGMICWGQSAPRIKKDQHLQNFISSILPAFLTSTFNSDLRVSLPSRKQSLDLRSSSGKKVFFDTHAAMIEKNEFIVTETNGISLDQWFKMVLKFQGFNL